MDPNEFTSPRRTDEECVEFTTTIRGRPVSCRLEAGRLHGDTELLGRVRRAVRPGELLDPSVVARMIARAVGSEVTLHLCDATDQAAASA